jgi:glycosyltransferase involved in cell wall biosynthesis
MKEYLRRLPELLDTLRLRGDGILLMAFLAACLRLPKILVRRIQEASRIRFSDRQVLQMTRNARKSSNGRARRAKILLVTPFLPYPVTNGGAVRINSLTRHLAPNYDFHMLSFVEQASDQSHASLLTPPFQGVEIVKRIPVPVRDMLSAEVPESYSHYMSDAMRESMEMAIEKIRPDIVQIEFPWMAGYAPSLRSVPSVLIEHDVGNLLPGRGFLRESKGVQGYRFSLQAMNWTVRHLPWFDRVVTVTPEDEQKLRWLFPGLPLRTVETGVDIDEFSYSYDGGEGPTLVYLGHYRHFPNEDAALWLLEEIFPRIHEKVPSARLFLVGSHPTRGICAWKGTSGVHVTGTVENVRPYFKRASLFLAPIRKGAGIKGKLLEAMAMGTPIVATSCANAGIAGRDGSELRIADRADAFAETVVDLLQDEEQRMYLSRMAREWVEERFDWRILAEKMAGVYQDLAG